MKNNLPKYLLYTLLVCLGCSIFGGMVDEGGTFLMGIIITGLFISPVVFAILVIHKFITWKINNKYFYPTLTLTIILISVVLYIAGNIF